MSCGADTPVNHENVTVLLPACICTPAQITRRLDTLRPLPPRVVKLSVVNHLALPDDPVTGNVAPSGAEQGDLCSIALSLQALPHHLRNIQHVLKVKKGMGKKRAAEQSHNPVSSRQCLGALSADVAHTSDSVACMTNIIQKSISQREDGDQKSSHVLSNNDEQDFRCVVSCLMHLINMSHYEKLGKKRRESSKRNYYTISPRVMKAIIIISSLSDFSHAPYTAGPHTWSLYKINKVRARPSWALPRSFNECND